MNLPNFLKKDKATFKSVLLNNLLLNNTFERFFATLVKAYTWTLALWHIVIHGEINCTSLMAIIHGRSWSDYPATNISHDTSNSGSEFFWPMNDRIDTILFLSLDMDTEEFNVESGH